MFNAVVAPAIFDAHHEFLLAIAATAAFVPTLAEWQRPRCWTVAAAAGFALAAILMCAPWLAVCEDDL